MSKQEAEKIIMAQEEKSVVESPSLWAQLAVIACGAVAAIPDLAEVVAPVLSVPGAGYVIMGAGVLTAIRRIFCEQKEITSVLPKSEE